ncbi:MAG: hypothetical protein BWY82_00034 [Verrucomicrobia bacterium ADurb.Bin474]|nr:MAG: hypothetical protein BWY82_00034 [Verrucomicrobia bacterium ADurb.Bin474]
MKRISRPLDPTALDLRSRPKDPKMHSSIHTTKTGIELHVREAIPDDSAKLIAFLEDTSGESDNLSFGPGDLGLSEEKEGIPD